MNHQAETHRPSFDAKTDKSRHLTVTFICESDESFQFTQDVTFDSKIGDLAKTIASSQKIDHEIEIKYEDSDHKKVTIDRGQTFSTIIDKIGHNRRLFISIVTPLENEQTATQKKKPKVSKSKFKPKIKQEVSEDDNVKDDMTEYVFKYENRIEKVRAASGSFLSENEDQIKKSFGIDQNESLNFFLKVKMKTRLMQKQKS